MRLQCESIPKPDESLEQGDFQLKHLPCFNFYRGWRMISEYYRAHLSASVSPQASYILELCDTEVGVDVGLIASALEIDQSAISAMLKRMDGSGLTRRTVMPEDRRHTLVFLTEAGRQLRDEIREEMIRADENLRRYVSKEDIEALCALVERIKIAAKVDSPSAQLDNRHHSERLKLRDPQRDVRLSRKRGGQKL